MHHHELYDEVDIRAACADPDTAGGRIVGCADALTVRMENGDTLSDALEHIVMREHGKYDPKVIAAIEQYRSKARSVCGR
jgi:hypothetical protein